MKNKYPIYEIKYGTRSDAYRQIIVSAEHQSRALFFLNEFIGGSIRGMPAKNIRDTGFKTDKEGVISFGTRDAEPNKGLLKKLESQ